jgi:hypothetical protein
MIGPVIFNARKKHQGANGATISSNSVVVTQSQTLNYFHESPPHHSPFAGPMICPVGSPLADVNAFNKIVTGGPVGGLSLGVLAAARQLFDVPAHNLKKSMSKAVRLKAVSIFPWLCQSYLTQLRPISRTSF